MGDRLPMEKRKGVTLRALLARYLLMTGALLALLLPLSGASRRKEPFATLLVVPMIVLIVLLALQLMRALGVALPFQPVSGCTMMIECTFLSFMTVQAIRTKT